MKDVLNSIVILNKFKQDCNHIPYNYLSNSPEEIKQAIDTILEEQGHLTSDTYSTQINCSNIDATNIEEVRRVLFNMCLGSENEKFVQFCRTLYDNLLNNKKLIDTLVDYIDVNTYRDNEECEIATRFNCECNKQQSCEQCILNNISSTIRR